MVHGSAAKGGPGMSATMIKLFKNEDGATAIEYGLIAALIAVAAVTVLGTVGTNLTRRSRRSPAAPKGIARRWLRPGKRCASGVLAGPTPATGRLRGKPRRHRAGCF